MQDLQNLLEIFTCKRTKYILFFLVLSSWTGLPFLCNEVQKEKRENGWQFLHEERWQFLHEERWQFLHEERWQFLHEERWQFLHEERSPGRIPRTKSRKNT
jgi:hypothetical protein